MKQINQTSFTSWIFLLSLATIWGVNFLFIKLAVEEIGPITNVFFKTFDGINNFICSYETTESKTGS